MTEPERRIELTWMDKQIPRKLVLQVAVEQSEFSYANHMSGDDIFDNRLIHGDNLQALECLKEEFTGKIKCIFIDPPYNTGNAFTQYDDCIEHSLWLSLMHHRMRIFCELLRPDGSIWITLDDREAHYMKVMCDEVFGRSSFIADISWQKRDGAPNDRKIGALHDHLLVFGKSKDHRSSRTMAEKSFNLMPRTEKADSQYRVFPEPAGPDARGPFRKTDATANGKGGRFVQSLCYPVRNPYTGKEVVPGKGRCWVHSREEMTRLQEDGRLYWGARGTARTPCRKLFKSEAKPGMTAPSIWSDCGFNQHASAHLEQIFGEKAAFETPKPEQLLQRIIHIASDIDDIVLDSFLGSGTTAAVAHKMRRRWIGVELGNHVITHCVPRLRKVIDGEEPGGVTDAVNWKGGGGFRFYKMVHSSAMDGS